MLLFSNVRGHGCSACGLQAASLCRKAQLLLGKQHTTCPADWQLQLTAHKSRVIGPHAPVDFIVPVHILHVPKESLHAAHISSS